MVCCVLLLLIVFIWDSVPLILCNLETSSEFKAIIGSNEWLLGRRPLRSCDEEEKQNIPCKYNIGKKGKGRRKLRSLFFLYLKIIIIIDPEYVIIKCVGCRKNLQLTKCDLYSQENLLIGHGINFRCKKERNLPNKNSPSLIKLSHRSSPHPAEMY